MPARKAQRRRAKDQEAGLAPDAFPVHQDQRQHAPDGDVVQAGVAQDALARLGAGSPAFPSAGSGWAGGNGAGHATPATNCQGALLRRPSRRARQQHGSRQAAEGQGHAQGERGGEAARGGAPGLARSSRCRRSTRTPSPPTRPRRSAPMITRREHEAVVVGEGRTEQARPEQDAGEDLHHHQRRDVVGATQAPDE